MPPVSSQALISEPILFSATTLQTYQNCSLQYKFCYVDKIPVPPTPPMLFGSAIHSVIEHLTTRPHPSLEPKDHALSLLEKFWPSEVYPSEVEESEARNSAYAILDTYLAWQEANQNTITGVEHEFTFPFASHTLNGFIDRIEQTPDGGYVVIDFKSGKKPGTISKNTIKQNIQINMYCLAVQQMTGALPNRAELFFLKDGKHVHYVPNEETITAFTDTIISLIKEIISEKFTANPDFFRCKYCGYQDRCRDKWSYNSW
jgi:DNA helicase-2/ATP-dependent DNA helicase PcrA